MNRRVGIPDSVPVFIFIGFTAAAPLSAAQNYVPLAPPEARRPRMSNAVGPDRPEPPGATARHRDEPPIGGHAAELPRRATAASPAAPQLEAPEPATRERRVTVVVDIDETLCVTDYTSVLWGIGRDDSSPLAHSVATLNRLAETFEIVYLTARPRSCESKTLAWLRSRGFPNGRLVTSPTLGDFLAQTGFKKNALARLQREHDHMLIGIGDKPTDAEAYRENGMLAVVVNPWPDRTYRRDEIILRDWRAVGRFFEQNRETLRDPVRLAEGLRRGDISLVLPN